ncbi:hypothetical protein CAPTEDRAFT_174161 [Capitella teleta]|uniref:Aladin seven-bladed propeller domain-containing protein n=1 Tax=Capitella teleta TaxID=283909 RepID=R7VE40_CAPTE|nr:hypothetical protein CAPTEDRAFT_174161 [Capitella teleta]|eukprot:ELU13945.1 hypothetical protein CAPTEDRAFT_174161 [Capitella teleta]
MCSLVTFPPPPPEGFVTLSEQNAKMVACIKSEVPQSPLMLMNIHQSHDFPDVDISRDAHCPTIIRDSEAKAAFLQHQETPRKRLIAAWYEHGVSGILEELSNCHGTGPNLMKSVASALLATIRWTSSLHSSLFPHLAMSNEELIAEFSTNPHWFGLVRSFAWHPHTTKFAVALRDDSVRVHSARKGDIIPTLRHKLQKGVISLAWKSSSASVLAVGCKSCVLLWDVDPTSLATRPSGSSVQVLSYPGHSPITSLAWCPVSSLLASACPTDSSSMIWDHSLGSYERLRRVGGGGTSLVLWSPDGTKLLSACPSSVLRVWETRSWTCEKWTKLPGRCQAACWSPDSHVLLFATAEEPVVYCLTFDKVHPVDPTKPVVGGSKVAIAVADVAQIAMETEGTPVTVGGLIQAMCWDPFGERLAVSFKGPGSELIAVFQSCLQPSVELIPCGFIRGHPSSVPSLLSFHPNWADGALLTVAWSSGKISYVPMYFVPRHNVNMNSLYQRQSNGPWQSPVLFS